MILSTAQIQNQTDRFADEKKTSSLRLLAMLAFKESLWTTEFRIWDFDPWKFEEMIYDAP